MVSIRCKMIVKSELDNLGVKYGSVELGQVELKGDISSEKLHQLKTALLKYGLELMEERKDILIERIKDLIVEMVHYQDELPKTKNSVYISEKLDYNYTYLATLFSEVTGITIEHYIISHKIERVKELLIYDELSLKEISYKLNYSSEAHLCGQFKKITGITPTIYKHLKNKRLIALDNVGIM